MIGEAKITPPELDEVIQFIKDRFPGVQPDTVVDQLVVYCQYQKAHNYRKFFQSYNRQSKKEESELTNQSLKEKHPRMNPSDNDIQRKSRSRDKNKKESVDSLEGQSQLRKDKKLLKMKQAQKKETEEPIQPLPKKPKQKGNERKNEKMKEQPKKNSKSGSRSKSKKSTDFIDKDQKTLMQCKDFDTIKVINYTKKEQPERPLQRSFFLKQKQDDKPHS